MDFDYDCLVGGNKLEHIYPSLNQFLNPSHCKDFIREM